MLLGNISQDLQQDSSALSLAKIPVDDNDARGKLSIGFESVELVRNKRRTMESPDKGSKQEVEEGTAVQAQGENRPRELPRDLPKSLDDRQNFSSYNAGTEYYDAWQGLTTSIYQMEA